MAEDKRYDRLEQPTRLSRSMIWDLQRAFYLLKGPRAWSELLVPSAVSTNPRVASAYAHLVVSLMRDLHDRLNPDQPVYVVELGAGSGRLTYLLARALQRLESALPAGSPPVVVVGTDFAEANIEFARDHPFMAPFIEDGRVDFARFDADHTDVLELQCAGITVRPGDLENPVVLVANYVFDTLRADAYRVDRGDLFAVEVSAVQLEDVGPDPVRFEGYDIEVTERKVEGVEYDDPVLEGLLDTYREGLERSGVLMPVGPVDVMRRIDALTTGPSLVLFGDKAMRTLEELDGHGVAGLVKHGSFSLTVNLHALARVAEALGGFAVHGTSPDTVFTHSLLATKLAPAEVPQLTLAFETSVDWFGPRDAQRLTYLLTKELDKPGPMTVMYLLKLTGYDPWIYREYFSVVFDALLAGKYDTLPFLMAAMDKVAEHAYPMSKANGLTFQIGRGFQSIGQLRKAVHWYGESLRFDGPTAAAWFNMGMCLERLDKEEAIGAYQEVLSLKPAWTEARTRIERLRTELGQG